MIQFSASRQKRYFADIRKMVAKLIEWSRKYGTKYRVGELVRAGKLFRIEEGIYADVADAPEVEVVLAKYPASVLTLESAYYYYRMSDEIPDEYHLATDRKAATKLPYDLYREVIGSFRERRDELYGAKIDDYLKTFPRKDVIRDAIRREVY